MNSRLHPCRPASQPSSQRSVFLQRLPNFFRMTSLARSCPLTPIESYPCIKTTGGHPSRSFLASLLIHLAFPSSRDEKPVTATPLDSALTNRDAGKSFRIRSYVNCRGSFLISPRRHTCNFFKINTCRNASKQRTLSTFRINTYAKTGGGGDKNAEGGEGDRSQGCTDPRGRTLQKIKLAQSRAPASHPDEGRVNCA